VSLYFSGQLESIKTDFGSTLDTQVKEPLVTEFADITEEPQGLLPHRGIFDHKIRLTAYPNKRQRRNRLFVPEYEELKRQFIDLFNHGLVRVSNMLLQLLWSENLMVLFEY
jgi:hypothetical protein